MERIIITEVDNTSNVEALSSYDVAYVPGFSNNGASPLFENGTTLYRTPTLCTTKYEFLKLYGDTCPTFTKDQPYPIATMAKKGFPSYAIPNYVPESTPTQVAGLNNFSVDSAATRDQINAAITASQVYTAVTENVEDPSWTPVTGVVYYKAVGSTTNGTTTYSMVQLTETTGYSSMYLYTSTVSPVSKGWYLYFNGEYILTDDTFIDFDSNNNVKTYYNASTAVSLMFKGQTSTSAGDADPGYRYALYLLSLGIPVYYEQMNSSFEVVDLNDTSMYKTDSEGNVSPVLNEWFVLVEGTYIRTDDTTIDEGTTYYLGADMSVKSMYKGLEARFSSSTSTAETPTDYSFDCIGDYAIKYFTTGGYPVFEYGPLSTSGIGSSPIAESMIRLANERGDALALIDHTNNPNRTIYETDKYSVVKRVREEFASLGDPVDSYGAVFTPWYTCTHSCITGITSASSTTNYSAQMPASLAYLSALAQQLKNYNPWLAVSGVTRGQVPYCGGLHTNFQLTNNVADSYQMLPDSSASTEGGAVSINPLTYVRNYGYCIWGNRTLKNNSSGTQATSFLNIRNSVSDIKKQLYDASRQLMFEQNTNVLWVNFKAIITPLLDTMVSNFILKDYTVVKYNIDPETGQPVPAYKVLAVIKITPYNSIEQFELQIQLENSEVTVSETE